MTRHGWIKGAAIGIALGLAVPAAAQSASAGDDPHMTGVDPIAPAEYAKLPKLSRHRAWLPKSVDLTGEYPVPGAQGSEPNCVAWASTYAARSFLFAETIGHRPAPAEAMSPAYVYNRLRPPGTPCWGSVKFVDALNLLKNEGTVTFADFPDDMLKCKIPAPESLLASAAAYRISDWRAVDRKTPDDWTSPLILDDIKGTLARHVPVVFAMPAAQDFKDFKGSGIYRTAVNDHRNYHALALIGYDEDRQAFRVINSWGTRWGDGGYGWISYDAFTLLAGEAYALETPDAKFANLPPLGSRKAMDLEVAGFQCGIVTVSTVGGRQRIEGFGGVQESIDHLHTAAFAFAPDTDWQVAYHPWPQCEAETTLGRPLHVGGVGLVAQTENGAVRDGDPVALKAGDKFGIAAEVKAERPYLSIIYLQADGSAVELYRGELAVGPNGRRQISVGTGGPGQVRFEVGPPYGNEILVALASARPLFGKETETYATERQFLTQLRAHLLAAAPDSIAAAVLRLKSSQ